MTTTTPPSTEQTEEAPLKQRGRTLADEEVERLEAKRLSGNVLDPIALQDPVGQSVERIVLRVGIAVVVILVAGILLAQVACKNIRLSSVPDLASGVTESSVERALSGGVVWGGEIVRFPGAELTSFDAEQGVVCVTMTDESARTLDALAASAQSNAFALAMNVFQDEGMQTVEVVVRAHVSPDSGLFSTVGTDPMGEVLTVTWTRDAANPTLFSCTVEGLDLSMTSPAARVGAEELVDAADAAAAAR